VLLLSACAVGIPVKDGGNTAASVGSSDGPDSAGAGGDPLALSGGGGLIDPFELEEWDIVNFTDPRDSSTYEIIDGRVIIAFCDPPDLPVVDPNYFDVERDPDTDPFYSSITCYYSMTQTLAGMTMQYDPAIATFIAAENVTVYSEWPMVAGMAVTLPAGQTVADAVANWPAEYAGLIEAVDPDQILYSQDWPEDDPNDSLFAAHWNLREDQDYDIDIQRVWEAECFGHPGAVVAVIDSGVQYDDDNLLDMALNTTIYGCNTGDKKASTEFALRWHGGGEPLSWLLSRSENHAEKLGHGTKVASVISSAIDNDYHIDPFFHEDGCSVLGICHETRYYPIAVKAQADEDYALFSTSAILNAFTAIGCIKRVYNPEFCYGSSAYVEFTDIEIANISISTAGEGTEVGNEHIRNLGLYILFVSSAGNDSQNDSPMWPGNHDYVMSAASYNNQGNRDGFSNYSTENDISAPGSGIVVCDMYGQTSNGYTLGSSSGVYSTAEGTSYSCAHVSAIAALVCVKWQNKSPQQVRWQICLNEIHGLLVDPDVDALGMLSAAAALEIN